MLELLREVRPLAEGRTDARDPDPIRSVEWARIEAILPRLHPDPKRTAILTTMIHVQVLARLRPGELCALRPEFIERGRVPWRYDTRWANKNLHRDKERVAFFGPQARAILGPLLDATPPG